MTVLFAQYGSLIRAIARGLARQYSASTEDLEQEGYAALLALTGKLRPETAEAYVRVRVRGAMLDSLARELRHRHEGLGGIADGKRAPGPDPEAAAAAAEQRQRLKAAVADLPQKQRVVVELRLRHEMRQSQVGRELGITQPAVSQIEGRALRRLREALAS
ncbi:MAG: sigma-70 family RNA polymerase sigma factor [Bryobacteraceae bacterium]|nr:sigma-70 family RNA polymerase sigma factor [Bryobacteraceae bacterium]